MNCPDYPLQFFPAPSLNSRQILPKHVIYRTDNCLLVLYHKRNVKCVHCPKQLLVLLGFVW